MKASTASVIAWSQTTIDGVTGLPSDALRPGCGWSWTGEAVRLDGANDILVLEDAQGVGDLQRRAARAAHRLLRRASVDLSGLDAADPESEPRIDRDFTVTDGTRLYRVALIEVAAAARPLLMFAGPAPPRARDLWVVRAPVRGSARIMPQGDRVICFVRGTRLRTAAGPVAVEDLRPGDLLATRDCGLQEVRWIGRRHVSGARLAAAPHLRPVRVPTGHRGADDACGDLLISPRHRLLVQGAAARALFGTPEVLVEARDLLGQAGVAVDHTLRAVEYFHILLPCHGVVWANGVATESFHPDEARLGDLDRAAALALEGVVPGVSRRPQIYGDAARRRLTPAEAAILLGDTQGRALTPLAAAV